MALWFYTPETNTEALVTLWKMCAFLLHGRKIFCRFVGFGAWWNCMTNVCHSISRSQSIWRRANVDISSSCSKLIQHTSPPSIDFECKRQHRARVTKFFIALNIALLNILRWRQLKSGLLFKTFSGWDFSPSLLSLGVVVESRECVFSKWLRLNEGGGEFWAMEVFLFYLSAKHCDYSPIWMAGIHWAGNGLPSLFRKYAAIIIFFSVISSDKTKTAPILLEWGVEACCISNKRRMFMDIMWSMVISLSLSLSRKK